MNKSVTHFIIGAITFLIMELIVIASPRIFPIFLENHFFLSILPWLLLIFSISGIALFVIISIQMLQKSKNDFDIDTAKEERKERKDNLEFERTRMKQTVEFRQAMEKYEKVTGAIKELTSVIKNDKNNDAWPTRDQMDKIVRYIKEHETTFESLISKLNQGKNEQ